MILIWGKLPSILSRRSTQPSSASLLCDVHYYYIISPGVYIENDLTHLLTCHLIGGGTQKAWPPPPSPSVGRRSTNEPLYGFCGDYPLSLTMSANDRAGTILKWFLPLQLATYMWEGRKVMGRGESFIIAGCWTLYLFLSLCLYPLVFKRHQEQKGHRTLSHFLW